METPYGGNGRAKERRGNHEASVLRPGGTQETVDQGDQPEPRNANAESPAGVATRIQGDARTAQLRALRPGGTQETVDQGDQPEPQNANVESPAGVDTRIKGKPRKDQARTFGWMD